MRSFLIALYCLVLGTVCLPAAVFAAPPVLRVAVDAPYPPFAMRDAQGNLTGFDVDIAHALCKELNRTCDVRAVPFDDIIPKIVEGKIDVAVAGMGASEERKKLVDFTDRYFRSLSIFLEREGTVKDLAPETLKGLRVGAQEGTLQAAYLRTAFGDNIVLVTVPSHDEVYALLKKGEVDLILVDGLPGYTFLKSPEGMGIEAIGEAVESGGIMDWASIAVSKKQPELREAINKAIQTLRRNGEYGKINRKYFDFNVY